MFVFSLFAFRGDLLCSHYIATCMLIFMTYSPLFLLPNTPSSPTGAHFGMLLGTLYYYITMLTAALQILVSIVATLDWHRLPYLAQADGRLDSIAEVGSGPPSYCDPHAATTMFLTLQVLSALESFTCTCLSFVNTEIELQM